MVPEYYSNVRDRYEEPTDKGIYDRVELVWLRNAYLFDFEADSENTSHLLILPNLRQFLQALTGWNPLVVFPAIEVLRKSWAMGHSSSKGSADVLCFQKGEEIRIVIRRKSPRDGSTIQWMTAILKGSLDIKPSKLEMTLTSMQKGKRLALSTVTATDEEAETPTRQSEKWYFIVNENALKIRIVIQENLCTLLFHPPLVP